MKCAVLLCIATAMHVQLTYCQKDNLCVKEIEVKADSLYKIAQYNSAAHLYYLAAAQHKLEENWLSLAKNYRQLANSLRVISKYDSAMFYCYEGLQIAQTKFQENSKDEMLEKACVLTNIALIEQAKGKFNDAIAIFKNAVGLIQKTDSCAILRTAQVWSFIGLAYFDLARYDSALWYCNKSLVVNTKLFGENNMDVSYCYANLGRIYSAKGEFEKALDFLQKAYKIRILLLNENHPNIAVLYCNIGVIYERKGEYNTALEYYLKNLKILYSIYNEDHADIAQTTENIGLIYYYKGIYDEALKYFCKALKIRIKIFGEIHPDLAATYNDFGITYLAIGDFDKALEYHLKSLAIKTKVYPPNHLEISTSYGNIGMVYKKLGQSDKALDYYRKSLEIKKAVLGNKNRQVAIVYNNIGSLFIENGDMDSALVYCNKSLEIRLAVLKSTHPLIASCYHNIGLIYEKKMEYSKAIDYYQQALLIRIKNYGNKHNDVAATYNNLGNLENSRGNYLQSVQNYQKALIANTQGFEDSMVCNNPVSINSSSKSVLVQILAGKAKALYNLYKHVSHSYSDIEASLNTYDLLFQVINDMRNEYIDENTKFILGEQTKECYARAIRVFLENKNLWPFEKYAEKTFDYFERGKSATLFSFNNELIAKKIAGIPDSLISKEKQIKREIASYANTISLEKNKQVGYDTSKVNYCQDRLFLKSRALDSIRLNLEQKYPVYYQLKYSNTNTPISEVQKKIDRNSMIINYFNCDSSIFVSIIGDNYYDLQEIKCATSFKLNIWNYYKGIKVGDPESYLSSNKILYNNLIAPVRKYLVGKEHLIIIPDDYFYFIPFETLFTPIALKKNQTVDYTKLDYLINSYSISYYPSARLWYYKIKAKNNQDLVKHELNFIGFAPVFGDDKNEKAVFSSNTRAFDSLAYKTAYRLLKNNLKNITVLPYSKDEVLKIVDLFGRYKKEAKAYLYSEATESNFKNEINKYNIVHVSTHGFINENEPNLSGIVFSPPKDSLDKEDGVLYSGETYSINIKSDLVVLGTCESGVGKLIRGESPLAISRGFLYAGTPNIIFSLWKALDEPTKDLMVQFYSNVLEGSSYSQALRMAKLSLIKNSKTAFPHFWGGFVLTGL